MDQIAKLNRYRQILQQVVEHHAVMPAEPEHIESLPICDPVHGDYLLMDVDRSPKGSGAVVFHLRLKDGKVQVECDGIEDGIAQDLIEAGIPAEDIVFTFYGNKPQPYYELAAAA
ncbi:MAG: element excision factor XisI family protein [Acidobacteriota bacterium]|nr:element excision factor XisI family protein [Acidobacteriota bacterium]